MSGQALEFFEIDVPYCTRTYGVAPCTAAIGVTGDEKCFNCLATCQDTPNFLAAPETLRFAKQAAYLPRDIDIIGPLISAIDFTSGTISLAETIGTRSVLKVSFFDTPHSDANIGLDKYQDERGYDPYFHGSFWPRFRARYPSITGFECRWIIGFVGQALAEMETRTFFAEGFDGPSATGVFSISAKDGLKFMDGDRAQAPPLSNGAILADIVAADTLLTLTPPGVEDEYPSTGYVNLAGNELATFYRDPAPGIDGDTILLIHFHGADGATTFTDSSAVGRTVSRQGNTVVDDAVQFFPGFNSGLFDGSGDAVTVPDAADLNFGTAQFTIDCRIRPTSLASDRVICSQGTDASNQMLFYVGTNGALAFRLIIAAADAVFFASAAGAIVINSNYHVAVERSASNVWRMFINGVQVATQTASVTYPNFTTSFRIGFDQAGALGFAGWIGEFRLSDSPARYASTGFTPPTGPYQVADNTLMLYRGRLGSVASDHKAGDRVQLAINYASMDPADIINAHITSYTDLPAGYIDIATWRAETAAFLGSLYSFTIGEPTSVAAFLGKVIEQAGLMMWDDALKKQLRLKVIRAVPVTAAVISEDSVLNKTFEPTDQPDQRVSRAWVYYAPLDYTKKGDELNNYRSSVRTPDDAVATANEALYGAPAIKKIFADGIVAGGATVATRMGNLLVGRKQRPPRRFKFSQLRGQAIVPELGGGYYIDWSSLQAASGAREIVPVQVIKLKPGPAILQAEAEEMRFENLDAGDLLDRIIILNIDNYNLNLRTIHDQLFPATFGGGVTVTFQITAHIGSKTTANSAVNVGDWPVGFVPLVQLSGRIQGRGGLGGNGNTSGSLEDGQAGGTALFVRTAINLEFSGKLDGGGGGGGSGPGSRGGGGGAGFDPGLRGNGDGGNGKDGTTELGGDGQSHGSLPRAGDGGDPGQPGDPGVFSTGATLHPGGAAGSAIDGVSFVTFVTNTGTIRGPQVN